MPLPIDLNKDVAVGISLPIQGSSRSGYFNQTFTTLEQVSSNVINLLLTIPGERYMQPSFGSKLHEHLFEQFDQFVEEQIEDSITEAIQEWLPYVIIENLEVTDGGDLTNEDSYHTIKVSLTISITADPETHMNIKFRGLSSGTVVIDEVSSPTSDGGAVSGDSKKINSTKDTYDKIKKHSI
tara:strand:+ start:395 stop:940 length:546 start_codon:yes stop_codon:yes gene_type:complete